MDKFKLNPFTSTFFRHLCVYDLDRQKLFRFSTFRIVTMLFFISKGNPERRSICVVIYMPFLTQLRKGESFLPFEFMDIKIQVSAWRREISSGHRFILLIIYLMDKHKYSHQQFMFFHRWNSLWENAVRVKVCGCRLKKIFF